MKRKILLGNTSVKYQIKQNIRCRGIKIRVNEEGLNVTTYPLLPINTVEKFIKSHQDWIIKNLTQNETKTIPGEFITLKTTARKIAKERLEFFNTIYGFNYNKIYIRDQKTRWGSCSGQKNLNFNYRIAKLPPELADYVIVHELCHLQEMNHSHKFWDLVSKAIPDYKSRRRKLKSV